MDGDRLLKWRDGERMLVYSLACVIHPEWRRYLEFPSHLLHLPRMCLLYCSNDLHKAQRILEQFSDHAIVTKHLNKSFPLRSEAT
jgi:hypothetical protein